MIVELWLLFTAVIFTAVGYWFGFSAQAHDLTEATIDALIERGYLRTRRGSQGELEILKWDE